MTTVKAADIKNVLNRHGDSYIVLIYDTYALIGNPIDRTIDTKWIRVPDNQEISMSYDTAITLPGFRSKHLAYRSHKILDYVEAPVKKWAYEYKLAQMIANHYVAEIFIYDTCIAIGCNTLIIGYSTYLCYAKLFAKYMDSPICHDISFASKYHGDSIECEPIMRGPLIGKLPVDRSRTIDPVYQKMVKCRARGFIKWSAQLCDITIVMTEL